MSLSAGENYCIKPTGNQGLLLSTSPISLKLHYRTMVSFSCSEREAKTPKNRRNEGRVPSSIIRFLENQTLTSSQSSTDQMHIETCSPAATIPIRQPPGPSRLHKHRHHRPSARPNSTGFRVLLPLPNSALPRGPSSLYRSPS